jgi:peptidoglycan/LPS O-acetylase OafA/YrhL
LLVMLAGAMLLALVDGPAWVLGTSAGVRAALEQVANFAAGSGSNLGLVEHTWTLSMEEQFYIVWPLALIALLRAGPRWALGVCLGAIVAVGLWRVHLEATGAYTAGRIYKGIDTRADALLLGCAVALAAAAGLRLSARAGAILGPVAGVAIALLAVVLTFGGIRGVEYTSVDVSAAVLLASMVANSEGLLRVLSAAPLRWLGRRSYGVYLWHLPIIFTLLLHGIAPGPVLLVLSLPLTTFVAMASYRYIEQPLLRPRMRVVAAAPALIEAGELKPTGASLRSVA